jgi:hypothetical protein
VWDLRQHERLLVASSRVRGRDDPPGPRFGAEQARVDGLQLESATGA